MIRDELQALADELESNLYHRAAAVLRQIADAKPVAWRWMYKGKPEPYALGGSLCFDGTGPDADIEARGAAAEHPRTVQRLYALPPALRMPEPMTRSEISDYARVMVKDNRSVDWLVMQIEAETLHRVKEMNE